MSEDNNLFMDEITGLRLLHSFRENMQSHSAGEREKEFPSGERLSITDNIISAYLALLKKLKTQEQISSSEKKITDFIYQKLQEIKDDFNPFDYKTTDKKEDKSREKDKKEVDAHNKLVKKIKERIKTEIKGREKTTKEKGISIDDEPVSISIVLDQKRNCELYSIKFSQKSDP